MGVLKELRPAIVGETNIIYWAEKVATVVTTAGHTKAALEDAQDFLVGVMVFEDDEPDAPQRAKTSARLCKELLDLYLSRSHGLTGTDAFVASEHAQVMQQVEDVLIAFGRKRPKDLFNSIDDLVIVAESRLQSLSLLNAFLRHQTPHLYLVMNTPLVEHLLKCLMNDTSTTTLSVALTALIMLLPHIPGSLAPYLPRLFLIYSRILCWEKFSELSTEAQRNLVTDDRVSRNEKGQSSEDESECIGLDLNWEKTRPQDGTIEAATPELMTYFTYLYGLYPLNLMSYIRRPRRYLKNADFPSADAFDLDRAVIRSRTDQFRQMHSLHPNFYNLTVEEELVNPKWPKMDPADVVGQCQALCAYSKAPVPSPVPPPNVKLPDVPPMPPLDGSESLRVAGRISPAASHTSRRSRGSWRDTQSTAVSVPGKEDSPVSKSQSIISEDDALTKHPQPTTAEEKLDSAPQTNVAYLQREITLLRNDLNFERWHKAQHSEHISQIMRRNVKEATVEAETLNLINANRALKKQLEQLQKAREATIKDSALTRKQANNLEANMTERFNKLKLEQETWQADADELRRLRSEMKQYRELLVTTEARELNKSHQLELAQRDLDELSSIKDQLQHALRRLHEYEYREFDFETAIRERDILKGENETLHTRLQRNDDQSEPSRRRLSDPPTLRPVPVLTTPSSTSVSTQARRLRSKTVAPKTPDSKTPSRIGNARRG